MPLVRITLASGRPAADRRRIADAVHQALVATANVPADDRFQVVQEMPAESLVWDSTPFLGRVGFLASRAGFADIAAMRLNLAVATPA